MFNTLCNKSSAVAEIGDRGHNRHRPKSGGCCAPFRGGAGSPSNTMWPGPKYQLRTKWHLDPPAVWPQQTWAKIGGAGTPSNTVWPGLRPTSVPSGILTHPAVCNNRHGVGLLCPPSPFFRGGGGLGPHQTQFRLCTKWHLGPSSHLATADMGRKFGAVPLGGRRWVRI